MGPQAARGKKNHALSPAHSPVRARRLGAPQSAPPKASRGSLDPNPKWARPRSRTGAQLGPRAARGKKLPRLGGVPRLITDGSEARRINQ